MKSYLIAIASAVTVVCLATGNLTRSSADHASPENQPTGEQLLELIQKLEARVDQLEQRQPLLTTTIPRSLPSATPSVDVDPPLTPQQPVPESWRKMEFNGHHYYLVPLSTNRQNIPFHR